MSIKAANENLAQTNSDLDCYGSNGSCTPGPGKCSQALLWPPMHRPHRPGESAHTVRGSIIRPLDHREAGV